jgi:hypothetical protein
LSATAAALLVTPFRDMSISMRRNIDVKMAGLDELKNYDGIEQVGGSTKTSGGNSTRSSAPYIVSERATSGGWADGMLGHAPRHPRAMCKGAWLAGICSQPP